MYRQSEKNSLNDNISSIRPHNILHFGILTAELCWRVWGTPANFNGFCVLPSLLERRSLNGSQRNFALRLACPGLVHCIYTFGSSCPLTEFCHMQNSLRVHLRIIAQLCRAISSQLRHVLTIGKKFAKQQYVFHMFVPQYAEFRPTNS